MAIKIHFYFFDVIYQHVITEFNVLSKQELFSPSCLTDSLDKMLPLNPLVVVRFAKDEPF